MRKFAFVVPAALFGGFAVAEESPLAQCARVDDATARLACYDTVAGRPPPQPGTGAAVPVAVPAPPATNVDNFGKQVATGPESMTARIVGKFNEWGSGTLIKLDNGQVWKAVEDRSWFYPNLPENPEIEITKGVFGYRMEIKAIGRRFAVKRVS